MSDLMPNLVAFRWFADSGITAAVDRLVTGHGYQPVNSVTAAVEHAATGGHAVLSYVADTNEADDVLNADGVLIRVTDPTEAPDYTAMADYPVHLHFVNDGTETELCDMIVLLLGNVADFVAERNANRVGVVYRVERDYTAAGPSTGNADGGVGAELAVA